jgi:hypothetical protein
MARKKPARTAKKAKKQAKKKGASRPAARKTARKSAAKSAKKRNAKPARKSAPARAKASASARAGRSASRPKPKAAARRAPAAAKAAPKKKGSLLASAAAAAVGSALAAGVKAAMGGKKPNIDRPRKTVADVHGIPSSLDMDRSASAARTGRAEMKDRLRKNTSASPALTSGDVDADWESAESVGDEAPGGDNPTPDQDVVDDIGRALGVEYEDDEELQGGAEIADRDRNRWELDPSSKEDDEDEER